MAPRRSRASPPVVVNSTVVLKMLDMLKAKIAVEQPDWGLVRAFGIRGSMKPGGRRDGAAERRNMARNLRVGAHLASS